MAGRKAQPGCSSSLGLAPLTIKEHLVVQGYLFGVLIQGADQFVGLLFSAYLPPEIWMLEDSCYKFFSLLFAPLTWTLVRSWFFHVGFPSEYL
jgi:hypothetical protein